MPHRDLVIIESAGKAKAISTAWLRLRGDTPMVFATNGHLMVQPEFLSPLMIFPGFRDARHPRSEHIVNRLKTLVMSTGRVWIATDPDAEGEVIAHDVMRLCEQPMAAYRMKLAGLDVASIASAITSATPIDWKAGAASWPDAAAGHARRILDRLIAGVFGRPDRPVGRVLSGFLDRAARGPMEPPQIPADTAMNMADLLLTPELEDMSLQDIAGSAQRLYEKGLLSYPRTMSRTIPSSRMASVRNASRRAGGSPLEGESRGAHDGLCPLVEVEEMVRLADEARWPPHGQPTDRRVLAAITRGALGLPSPKRKKKPDIERRILATLLDAGLGRPSTWAPFCERNAEKGLIGADGVLTARGREWAEHQPPWLDADFTARMESLLDAGVKSPRDLVTAILSQFPGDARDAISDAIREEPRLEATTKKELEKNKAAGGLEKTLLPGRDNLINNDLSFKLEN